MDEGSPIAAEALENGVPVYASDGVEIGTVVGVLTEAREDIFHGLLVETSEHGIRFVEAEQIASLHELGVDLRIDAAAASALPPPEHKALVYKSEDPAIAKGWHHVVRKLERRNDWDRER
jgi:hypothetical protein